MTTYFEYEKEQITALMMGRRIIKAELGKDGLSGKLELDNGTVLYVRPNQGGCSCSAGDYFLTSLATCDNLITNVRFDDDEEHSDGWNRTYRIFVVADSVEINAVQVDGSDGNGYYGTGYALDVVTREP